jgi:arginyl-tRNA--protein-N-Asp/Glu arginylyltransferase
VYLQWNEEIISDFSDAAVDSLYNDGYVCTRRGKGVMHQTRSIRIDLSRFEPNSENRRVLKKTDMLAMRFDTLPYADYHWEIGKMAHDFYEQKFGKGTFSANKLKELMTNPEKSNFNRVFVYSKNDEVIGYCIALETKTLVHYSYPFYKLRTMNHEPSSVGMGMMLRAILFAKNHGKQYIYLGSAQRPGDTYKLQFNGMEWFTGTTWSRDIEELKKVLPSAER